MSRGADRDDLASSYYDSNAPTLLRSYEEVASETVHRRLMQFIPAAPARVLDVGAGSGRDAAWLARLGMEVIAVEPSERMRSGAMALHPDARITWIADRLPRLERVRSLGVRFEMILVSAVWMHVRPADKAPALACLRALLADGGVLCASLRRGQAARDRGFHDRSGAYHFLDIASTVGGLECLATDRTGDALGRPGVGWTSVVMRACRTSSVPRTRRPPAAHAAAQPS